MGSSLSCKCREVWKCTQAWSLLQWRLGYWWRNPSRDPAGWHPKLPWLPWGDCKTFKILTGKKIYCLSSFCQCETPELIFPASPFSLPPARAIAGKHSHVRPENMVEERAERVQAKGWLLLRLPRARAPRIEEKLRLGPWRTESNISPL